MVTTGCCGQGDISPRPKLDVGIGLLAVQAVIAIIAATASANGYCERAVGATTRSDYGTGR